MWRFKKRVRLKKKGGRAGMSDKRGDFRGRRLKKKDGGTLTSQDNSGPDGVSRGFRERKRMRITMIKLPWRPGGDDPTMQVSGGEPRGWGALSSPEGSCKAGQGEERN